MGTAKLTEQELEWLDKTLYEAEESGRFTKVMIVYSNAETSPVRLRIKGNAK